MCNFWINLLVLNVNKSVFMHKSTFFCPEKTDLF